MSNVKKLKEFDQFVKTVQQLRGPKGCPWDKKQTHQSLTRFALEECYELVDAIDSGEPEAIRDELGDLLLQVVLNAQIAKELNAFDVSDVIRSINEKMIRRHPHVFEKREVSGVKEIKDNWEEIKSNEKRRKNTAPFQFPSALPSLLRAHKIGEKTAQVGFDWHDYNEVFDKVTEEYEELKESIQSQSREKQIEELGDLLFTLAQLARHLQVDADLVLRQTNKKFEDRFQKMLDWCKKNKKEFTQISSNEKEKIWQLIKKEK